MMRIFLVIILLKLSVCAQTKDFLFLSKKIDSMVVEDQKWRDLLSKIRLRQIDSTQKTFAKSMFDKTDSLNTIEVKKIYFTYGYPKISMIGANSNHKFWLLVQHCDEDTNFQETILNEMEILINKNECGKTDYAYLKDRLMINKGEAQVYGTQVELNANGTEYIPKKLFEPEEVDKRREEMGVLPYKLKDYLNSMNRDFLKK